MNAEEMVKLEEVLGSKEAKRNLPKNCAYVMGAVSYKLRTIKKDSATMGYQYLQLPKLLEEIIEIISPLGACVSFDMEKDTGIPGLYQIIARLKMMETGETETSRTYLRISEEDIPGNGERKFMNFPQWFGACQTYGRRYALMNLFGIAPDADDDLNGDRSRETWGEKKFGGAKNR